MTDEIEIDKKNAFALTSKVSPHVTILVDNPYRFDALLPFAAEFAKSNRPMVLLTTLSGDAAQDRGAQVSAIEVLSSPADVYDVVECVLALRRKEVP